MGKVALDNTLQKTNSLLRILVRENLRIDSYKDIQKIVQEGKAAEFFEIGDQINVPWNDGAKQYTIPFDVVHFGEVELENGDKVPGMYLESHAAICQDYGIAFDKNEAFWYCDTELAAGTYHFTMGNSWGTHVVANKVYQFTLTKPVPQGGHLTGMYGMPDQAPTSWRIYSFENATTATALETVAPIEGSDGTDLGVISSNTKYDAAGLNNMQRIAYGYNRWAQSALRQWFNKDGAANGWWTPQNKFDHCPDEHATRQSFVRGLDKSFLECIKPIKVATALNTTSDSAVGTWEYTYDRFFLAGLEQEFIKPQLAGEGEAWDYWKAVMNGEKSAQYGTYPERIRYGLKNDGTIGSAQACRLRSAYRGYATHAWVVYASGLVSYNTATDAYRCAPACVIC